MTQVTFTGSAGTIANLNQNFTQLFDLRELISTAGYTAATPAIKIDGSLLIGIGTATPLSPLHLNAAAAASAMRFSDTTNGTYGFVGQASVLISGGASTDFALRAEADLAIRTGGGSGAERIRIGSTGHVSAGADNTQTFGTAVKRWSTFYAGTGSINTSDGREKTAVLPLTAAEIAAARDLAREIGTFQFLDAVALKGPAARQHVGMTVQRAIEIMAGHGLDPLRYGFVCHDAWPEAHIQHAAEMREHPTLVEADGRPLMVEVRAAWVEVVPAGDRYGFRADELLAFIARGFEARLSALEAAAP